MTKFLARVCLAWIALLTVSEAQQEFTLDWAAYAQFTAERFEHTRNDFSVGTERLRPRIQLDGGRFSAIAQLDFAVRNWSTEPAGTLAAVILDLFGDYRLSDHHRFRFGQFKTPLGMDFNVSSASLDITKRSMDAGLTLNRDLGLMLSGDRVHGGLSYDFGIFNAPGRSLATDYRDSQLGQDYAGVARLRFDEGPWHAEVAYGRAPNAGGPMTSAYAVHDFSIRYDSRRWRMKGEWIEGHNVRGAPGRTERVYYLHGGYQLRPGIELVARHYDGRSMEQNATTQLSNTYLGLTAALADYGRTRIRLQANYVIVGGDELRYTGTRGFRDNAFLIQLHIHVRKQQPTLR